MRGRYFGVLRGPQVCGHGLGRPAWCTKCTRDRSIRIELLIIFIVSFFITFFVFIVYGAYGKFDRRSRR